MDVVTKSGEVVNISEKQVYTFPNGLLGFENFKKYALIESEYEPFFWLQSLDEKNLAFLLIDPFLISSSYEADIDDESLRAINVQAPEDIIIMTIVTISHTILYFIEKVPSLSKASLYEPSAFFAR